MTKPELIDLLAQAKKIASVAQANDVSASRLARLFHYDPGKREVDNMTWPGEVALMLLRDGWGEDFVRSTVLHDAYRRKGGTWTYEEWDMAGRPTNQPPTEERQ